MRFLMTRKTGFTPEMNAKLEALGFELEYIPEPEQAHPEMDFSDVVAVFCYRFFIYNDISRFPALRYIHTSSAGIDHMPLDYIKAHNITLCNASGVYSVPMAEFALGGVLQIYKNAPRFWRNQAQHLWKQGGKNRELGGKNVLVVGAGSIGTEVAKRFSLLGCRVTGLRRHPAPAEFYDRVVSDACLDEVLPEADIVILTVPLSPETRHMMNAERIAKMKDSSVLVNVCRGAVVDTEALIEALRSKKLYGAAIDVAEQEPLPEDSPLWELDNIILTPHFSFNGEFNPIRMFDLLYKDTKNWVETQK